MKTTLIRGVPLAMQQDGWWLTGPLPNRRPRPQDAETGGDIPRAGLLALLLLLGDVLVWQVVPGLSLALFLAALPVLALITLRHRMTPRRAALVAGLTLLVLLPLVELVQPLSLLIAGSGLTALLALIAGLRPPELWRGALRLWPAGLRQTCADATLFLQHRPTGSPSGHLRALLLGWAMPLGLGALFLGLLLLANPVLQSWTDGLAEIELPHPARILFWLVLVPFGWTALSLGGLGQRLRLPFAARPSHFGPHQPGLVNPASMRRALVLFNLLFAVQTGMDLAILSGGIALPEGITYAEYAHRGAYPLLVTALMAGGFALATRRWTHADRLLRGLLMLWIAQNVALVASSLIRLDLYVDAYGLTHLRLHAAIWMVLVATGLGLVIWQTRQGHSNGWLLLRCAGLGAATLYVSAFVSFDAIVARHNLSQPVPFDSAYMCFLGDAAQPHLRRAEIAQGRPLCADGRHGVERPRDWREWGFRNWRARRSLATIQTGAPRDHTLYPHRR